VPCHLSHILIPLLSRQEGQIILFYLFLPFYFFLIKTQSEDSHVLAKLQEQLHKTRATENMPNTSRLGNSECLPVSPWQEECLSVSANVSE